MFGLSAGLDRDSEGLLLLTDDSVLKQRLTDLSAATARHTGFKSRGAANGRGSIQPMRHPMHLRIRKKDVVTKPARVKAIPAPEFQSERLRFVSA